MAAYEFQDVQLDVAFTKASSKAELTNLDNISTIVGKIAKWYDLYAWSAWTAPTVEVTGSGNAITAASLSTSTGKLTLTKESTFLTSATQYIKEIAQSGSGNAVTSLSVSGGKLTYTLGSTFLTQHPNIVTQTDTTSTSAPSFGGTFTAVDSVTRDSNGHVTKINTKTVTIPNKTMGAATASAAGSIGLVPAPAAGKQTSFLRGDGTWVIPTNSTYTAGTGLALSGTTFNHSNSVTAVTTASLLKFKYDAQGHITGSSAVAAGDLPTHTHYEQDIKFDTSYSYKPQNDNRFPITAQPLINTMRTNKFVFLPSSSITIEHSTDGGSTYTDSGYTDTGKCNLFTSRHIGAIPIGPNTTAERTTSMRTMVTITRDSRYTRIDRFYIWFSTSGHTAYVDIQYATNAADTTWVDWRTNIQLLGWSGPNLINGPVLVFGASDSHVKKIRFIFRYASIRADYKTSPSRIFEIAAYSDYPAWTATNNMMMNDHLYYWDKDQIAYFPAEIKVPTQLRVHFGNYGTLFRNDGTNTWILLTNSGEAESGSWNSLRPFSINNSTGLVTMGEGLKVNTKDGVFLEIHGSTSTSYAYGSSSPKIRFTNTGSDQNADLIWDDHDTYCTPASLTLIGNQAGTYFIAPRIRLFSAPTAGSLIDIDDTNDKNFHLRYKSSLYGYANIISVYPGTANGCGVIFNNTGGGLCIIGGGESASSLNQTVRNASTSPYGDAWTYGTENMVIGADTSIYFVSGANSLTTTNHTDWTNLKTALFDSDGRFRPSVDNKGQIGASNYRWNAMYATTFVGNLNGDITAENTHTSTSDFEEFVPFVAKFDSNDAYPDDGQSIAKKPYFASDCYFVREMYSSSDPIRQAMTICLGNAGFSSAGGIMMCDGTDADTNTAYLYATNPHLERGAGPNTACFAFGNLYSSSTTDVSAFIPGYDAGYDLGHPDYQWRYVYANNVYANNFVGALNGNASTASKLGTSTVGGTGRPIYLSSGTPTACSIPSGGAWWNTSNVFVPYVSTAGDLKIGRYIDFHATAASTRNYDYRFEANSTAEMRLSPADTNNVLTLTAAGYNQIRFQTSATNKASTAYGIVSYPLATSGQTMLIQGNGNMVIGGGEFASSAYARKDSTNTTQVGYDNIVTTETEKLYLGADTEVQIISNGGGIATYNNNNHKVWYFKANGNLEIPGSITSIPAAESSGVSPFIRQNVKSTSDYVRVIQWFRGGSQMGSYGGSIGFHSTGGDQTTTSGDSRTDGAIIMVPYKTDTSPWNGTVGLYIGKGILKLDGTNVSLSTHTHNYAASATAGGTAKGSESWKFTHGNELNVSKLSSSYHHCWIGYRFNTDGTEEVGDSTYYISEWRFGDCKGGGLARIYPSAVTIQQITIQTGSSKMQKITLQTLMTWLITTKGYIHSNVNEHVVLTTTFAYANNDILQFTVNGTNMELQLAGVLIEFIGNATSYNSGVFVLKITAAPTNSFTSTSGYTKFYANHTAVYHCNGSGYSPAWSVDSSRYTYTDVTNGTTSSVSYGIAFAETPNTSKLSSICKNNDFRVTVRNGTTSAAGITELILGNNKSSTTADNKEGVISMYGNGTAWTGIHARATSSNRTVYLPDASGEIMVRKRTISQQNQSENAILNGQQLLYQGTGTISLGEVDVDITGLFTNWSVIMFTIIAYGFGSSGASNKFSISGVVPLDLVKRYYDLYGSSSSGTLVVAGIQYNPSITAGNGYFYAQYVNDNKIRFLCTMNGKCTSVYVYGLY